MFSPHPAVFFQHQLMSVFSAPRWYFLSIKVFSPHPRCFFQHLGNGVFGAPKRCFSSTRGVFPAPKRCFLCKAVSFRHRNSVFRGPAKERHTDRDRDRHTDRDGDGDRDGDEDRHRDEDKESETDKQPNSSKGNIRLLFKYYKGTLISVSVYEQYL